MTFDEHEKNSMRYIDGEMNARERETYEKHLETCESCKTMIEEMSALKEVTDTMKIAELPEAVWEKYWTGIFNRVERSIAWFVFIAGALIVTGHSVYQVITDPGIHSVVGLGVVMALVGFAILFLSVLREKLAVNKKDRYISEVDR